jgi:hypothetical protein
MSDRKKFVSARKVVEIQVDDQVFIIKAMSGSELEAYRQKFKARFDVNPEDPDKSILTDLPGMMQELFDCCLFKSAGAGVAPTPAGKVTDIWSGECCSEVFAECQRVCGLTDEGVEDAKND